MKKLLLLFVVTVIFFSFASCGKNSLESSDSIETISESVSENDPLDSATEELSDSDYLIEESENPSSEITNPLVGCWISSKNWKDCFCLCFSEDMILCQYSYWEGFEQLDGQCYYSINNDIVSLYNDKMTFSNLGYKIEESGKVLNLYDNEKEELWGSFERVNDRSDILSILNIPDFQQILQQYEEHGEFVNGYCWVKIRKNDWDRGTSYFYSYIQEEDGTVISNDGRKGNEVWVECKKDMKPEDFLNNGFVINKDDDKYVIRNRYLSVSLIADERETVILGNNYEYRSPLEVVNSRGDDIIVCFGSENGFNDSQLYYIDKDGVHILCSDFSYDESYSQFWGADKFTAVVYNGKEIISKIDNWVGKYKDSYSTVKQHMIFNQDIILLGDNMEYEALSDSSYREIHYVVSRNSNSGFDRGKMIYDFESNPIRSSDGTSMDITDVHILDNGNLEVFFHRNQDVIYVVEMNLLGEFVTEPVEAR